jgi:phosphatidylglycerophosphate synthase
MQATVRREGRQATRALGPADVLTVSRLPLAAVFLAAGDSWLRPTALAAAIVTDLLDGWVARRWGASRLGVALDPVADKLFMAAAFWVVWRSHALHPVEIIGVLLRDFVALFAFLTTVGMGRATTLPARAGGKAVTVAQALTLIAFLAESPLVRPLAWATAAVSVYAIWDYTRVGLRVVERDTGEGQGGRGAGDDDRRPESMSDAE